MKAFVSPGKAICWNMGLNLLHADLPFTVSRLGKPETDKVISFQIQHVPRSCTTGGVFTVSRSDMFIRPQTSLDGQFYVRFGRENGRNTASRTLAFSPPLEGIEAR